MKAPPGLAGHRYRHAQPSAPMLVPSVMLRTWQEGRSWTGLPLSHDKPQFRNIELADADLA